MSISTMQAIINITDIVNVILIVIAFIWLLTFLLSDINTIIKISVLILIAVCLVTNILFSYKYYRKANAFRIENGYSVYLDGELVPVENIDLNLYNKSFDDEQKKIFITRK